MSAENGRQTCTPDNPMPKNAPGRWEHTNVHETDYDSDYSVEYECEDCGHMWREELPQ